MPSYKVVLLLAGFKYISPVEVVMKELATERFKLPAISTLGKTEDETRKEQRLRLEKLKTQAQQDSLTSTECKELSKMIKESTLHYTDTVNEWRNQITQSSAPNSRGGRSKKRKRKSKKRKSKKR